VEHRGGRLGPDLSDAGVLRTLESLRLAITDPDAELEPEYFTTRLLTKKKEQIEGIRVNEDDFSIQLLDTQGNPRSFRKDELNGMWRAARSLMPSYRSRLTAPEIESMVVWLSSLKAPLVPPGDDFLRTRSIAPVSERIDWLTRPSRDADEQPDAVLDFLRIPTGSVVADVGAGTGYFTWRLASRVGQSGRVIAVEIQSKMLALIAEDLEKRNITNVDLVLGRENEPRLPEDAVDLVFMANAYHEFAQPEAMMNAIRRSLKPHGRVVVLEYRKEKSYSPVEALHKMTLHDMRSEIESAGFETEQVLDTLPIQHFLIFRKRQRDGAPR
jgi:putative heme-binding domain-containing protein